MRRIVSVWLPAWPIERLRRHRGREQVPADRPLALVASGANGLEIAAVNEAARALRVRTGAGLADTRAALPALITLPADACADRAGLARLVRWCGRYGPARHLDGEDGLWIDITGVAHLFVRPAAGDAHASAREEGRKSGDASERALLDDLVGRLSRFGLTVRAGLADTLGSAHATARFATTSASPFVIVPPGDTQRALAALPVAALRLDADAIRLLERLGLRTIEQLYGLPRAALERRFRNLRSKGAKTSAVAATVLRRLDQALGHHAEPRAPLFEAPDFAARLPFPDPLVTATGIEAALDWLCRDLAGTLAQAGVGGRRFRLTLYRTDGSTGEVTIGTSAPCRDDAHMRRLLGEKITDFDAGFGIDLMTLGASGVERLDAHQQGLDGGADRARTAAGRLIDRLSGRLGSGRVLRLRSYASHIPEVAQQRVPALGHGSTMTPEAQMQQPSFDGFRHRPSFLLDPPEPIAVLAAVPEGAPMLITWRRVRRRIARAEGPERIAPAWWESIAPPVARSHAAAFVPGSTRDYYLVETATGARYWVFRAGLYIGEIAEDEITEDAEEGSLQDRAPRWFMHGLLS
jgi:protein ImuB